MHRVLRWTMSLYFRARLKIRFEGEENVPDKGPFILVLSHQSHLDSLLLHTFCPRLMFTLAKARDFDIVLGSRYLDGRVTVINWPMSRLLISFRRELVCPIRDTASCAKLRRGPGIKRGPG